jgi:hypothetical protein
MRATAPLVLVLLLGCSFDWNQYDPRLDNTTATNATGGAATAGSGGVGGSPAGGAGGATCSGGTERCDGSCIDTSSDADHCGDCTTQCPAAELCAAGLCQPAATCNDLLQARPTLTDGVYTLAPDGGAAPFEAHCDMTTEGGGWTLVASVVDNSYFNGARCQSFCDPTAATTCDETPFTANEIFGDVASMLTADHKSAAYGSVPFGEMLFVDSNAHYASYDVSGASVVAWYPAGLENYVPAGTEAHDTFSYPAKASDLDPSVNACGTLRVSFNVEDSDSPVGGSCHTTQKGPAWSGMNNGACFWDDVSVRWTRDALYQGNPSDYRLWLVR